MNNEDGDAQKGNTLSLRGGSGAVDVAIHRVSRDTVDLSVQFLVHSGSPRAFSPRDDKCEGSDDKN